MEERASFGELFHFLINCALVKLKGRREESENRQSNGIQEGFIYSCSPVAAAWKKGLIVFNVLSIQCTLVVFLYLPPLQPSYTQEDKSSLRALTTFSADGVYHNSGGLSLTSVLHHSCWTWEESSVWDVDE